MRVPRIIPRDKWKKSEFHEADFKSVLMSVSIEFQVCQKEIMSRKRSRELIEAKHALIGVLLTWQPNLNISDIGRYLGQTHGAITNSFKQFTDWRATDKNYKRHTDKILTEFSFTT